MMKNNSSGGGFWNGINPANITSMVTGVAVGGISLFHHIDLSHAAFYYVIASSAVHAATGGPTFDRNYPLRPWKQAQVCTLDREHVAVWGNIETKQGGRISFQRPIGANSWPNWPDAPFAITITERVMGAIVQKVCRVGLGVACGLGFAAVALGVSPTDVNPTDLYNAALQLYHSAAHLGLGRELAESVFKTALSNINGSPLQAIKGGAGFVVGGGLGYMVGWVATIPARMLALGIVSQPIALLNDVPRLAGRIKRKFQRHPTPAHT